MCELMQEECRRCGGGFESADGPQMVCDACLRADWQEAESDTAGR
jgi:hypothetical protein